MSRIKDTLPPHTHKLTKSSKCVDVTLTEPEEVEEITKDNCYNSSNLAFNLVYATSPIGSAASATFSTSSTAAFALLAAAVVTMVGGFLV
jgi:hypothetical protein